MRDDLERAGSTIHVAVPADQHYLRLLRLTAAAAATDIVDDLMVLDDLRLAVDELAVGLIDASPPGEFLDLQIDIGSDELVVTGRICASGVPTPLSAVGELLVSSVCCRHAVGRDGRDMLFELAIERPCRVARPHGGPL